MSLLYNNIIKDKEGKKRMKVGFISLGCSKNLVDSEMMIGLFEKNGYEIVNDPVEAEIIVINTCGFIESAKKEAIDTILEMVDYKENRCQYLIVTGCLVERYQEELEKELPEVDLWISLKEYEHIWKKINTLLKQESKYQDLDYKTRKIATNGYYAYLKIAEGCSNCCTYCAIPMIRGPFVSRPMEAILEEAKDLARQGVQELIVIAQDTTKYGIDLYGESKLAVLLKELEKIEFQWIRFLYSYPEMITDELIDVVANSNKICHYFDIPMQHICDTILKRMGRKSDGESIRRLIFKIRKAIPDVVIRTTFIVGFPGETEEDFKELETFVKETRFDRFGVFAYSKEDGTPAVKLDGHMEEKIKKQRAKQLMKIQNQISKNNNQKLIGKVLEVLLEDITEDGEYYVGRSYRDVPEMDGIVFVKKDRECIIGSFVSVKVENAMDYDLVASLV